MSFHGLFHRRGAPGGPRAEVSILPISGRAFGSDRVIDASLLDAGLLDAGEAASELELLRTVAFGLGVVGGRDDHGVWSVLPNELRSVFASAPLHVSQSIMCKLVISRYHRSS